MKIKREEELIYGVNPVIEAIRSGRDVKRVYVSRGRREKVGIIFMEAQKRNIDVVIQEKKFFDSKFPKGHQGVAALTTGRRNLPIDDLLDIPFRRGEDAFFVILDCIEDPRNVGAIIRTAEAAGVHGVVMQAYRAASIGPEVIKTSAGASEYVPVSIVTNIKQAIQLMKERDILVVGSEAGGSLCPWSQDLTGSLGIVIGSEGKGIRRTVRDSCDIIISLPMLGRVNSLNVSVATGIVLFEIVRQRMKKKEIL